MKKSILFFLLLFVITSINAQTLLEENFEGSTLPDGWTQQTLATDGGWIMGTAASLESQFWAITDNGSRIIATNDDGCNCNKSEDYLILPVLDFSDSQAPVLEFNLFYGQQTYNGVSERAFVEVSTDGGDSWTRVEQLTSCLLYTSDAADE